MIIRKLTPADYHGMLVLYRELDQFHVDARPDFFVRQEDVFPQEAFEANMINPECLMLGAFDEPDNMIGLVRATLWKESGMSRWCVWMMSMLCRNIGGMVSQQSYLKQLNNGRGNKGLQGWNYTHGILTKVQLPCIAPWA